MRTEDEIRLKIEELEKETHPNDYTHLSSESMKEDAKKLMQVCALEHILATDKRLWGRLIENQQIILDAMRWCVHEKGEI